MNSSARTTLVALCLLLFAAISANAQALSQPTPPPIVTADSELWYLNGEPITYAGNFYYPAGAQVHFSPNEMVRSGFFMGVPLYSRRTDEPYSAVYVPLARGFMQPYMRLRTGDVAGTSGTQPLAGAAAFAPTGTGTVPVAQAAGSSTLIAGAPADDFGRPTGTIPAVPRSDASRPMGTSGVATLPEPGTAATTGRSRVEPMRTHIGGPPKGLNAVFVEFRGSRWFAEGQPVPLDRTRMIEIGIHGGFPVFADRDEPELRIYIATVAGGSMVAPYRRK